MSFENITPAATGDGTTPKPSNEAFLIVGDRAFKTQDDVVTKIASADQHIGTIEEENAKLRERLAELERAKEEAVASSATAAEILAKLDAQKSTGNTGEQEPVSKADLEALKAQAVTDAMAAFTARQDAAKYESNLDACMDAAKAAYGDSMAKSVSDVAASLKMSMADVDKMAQAQPDVFRRLFLPSQSSTPQITTGGVLTGAVTQQGQPKVDKPERSVMAGSTTRDVLNMWNYSHPDNYQG